MLAFFGIASISLIGCGDLVEQNIEVQRRVAAFVDACAGNLSTEATVGESAAAPFKVVLTCDNANKDHDFFKDYSQEDLKILREVK